MAPDQINGDHGIHQIFLFVSQKKFIGGTQIKGIS
jgi:hypothetical protein